MHVHERESDHGAGTRWTDDEFRRLRGMGDPEMDGLVAARRRADPSLRAPTALMGSLMKELGAEPEGALGGLAAGITPPAWGRDRQRIERGQRIFTDYGLYQAAALFFACLPLAYAAPAGAKVLIHASDLANGQVSRRLAQTGQMLIDLMGMREPADGEPASLEPGGRGLRSAIGLRLLHSCVRAVVLDLEEERAWDAAAYGPPVNQELLLATLLDFSLVTWEVMERMGVPTGDGDREANLYTWSVFGHLMGVESCRHGPLTLADADVVGDRMGRLFESTEEGRRLMAALLEEMEDFMFLGCRKLPRSLIHWLFRETDAGVAEVPRLLGVPRPAWWSAPLFATAAAAQRFSWLPDPLRPVVRRLIRKAGRAVVIAYADRHAGGPAPFQIPAEVARGWRIRQRPAARQVRDVRRHLRDAARAPLRPLRQAAGRRKEEALRHGSPRTRNADHRHSPVH
ncbi:oxygenase MpaB family protein [Spirillospora sp. NPDC047279]|uniref:oxygenase MpaB family protein n=1 Tax=Spirillospora sp. NPDC047279 TaxID=3155478 RepID=UPI0033CB5102